MSTRIVLSVIVLVVAVGALVLGAMSLLSRDDDVARDDPPRQGVEQPDDQAPEITEQTPRERTQIRHDLPWPFAEFAEDISELRRPIRRYVTFERDRIEREIGRSFLDHKLSLNLEDASVDDVVLELTRHFAPKGLKVYTQGPPVENDPVFESFVVEEKDVFEIVEEMRLRTNDLVTFAVTPAGLCVGSKKACINARADAQKWEEEQVGQGSSDEEFDFLEGQYRPNFAGAHIGFVIRDVREQCGAEVVVGPELWSKPIKVTWASDPMPVLAALRQIALKCGGALYAKDGRVFLLDR